MALINFITIQHMKSLGGAVGIANGYGLERGCRSSPGRSPYRTGSWTQPAFYPMDTGVLSPGLRQQGLEADHSSPASTDVKKTRIYTATPPLVFMA
jgi:hypothetical protein